MKDSILYMLSKIPTYVYCGGYEFLFKVLHESNEVKIGYFFLYDNVSYWKNPITNSHANFLYLHENIIDNDSFFSALQDCEKFLKVNSNLITY